VKRIYDLFFDLILLPTDFIKLPDFVEYFRLHAPHVLFHRVDEAWKPRGEDTHGEEASVHAVIDRDCRNWNATLDVFQLA
jgi:hypothetical protein